ncbi:threonylcarbamoyl-AMP synthase [Lottiidibacillus patelloidae]|uniref:Threonylcarbamoyl-AMP synthase n=1 Tax=Lottiidibacillus patelloidae TaxID=2670334 RepID=A0A263BSX7_9BACI|nr:L-threonylcarbamoyladenylate synthase [Lottiidibacillus patelloidae]OZM56814.1 threonylcarbamoyl-AMP synthase [Lottiidibacillus patelloidae]
MSVENKNNYPQLKEAAQLLQANEVVAFPTETVYGLGGNALSDEAVDKIFAAKGRPSDNPLIVHIAQKEQLHTLVTNISETAEKLMEAFWPGPLTVILHSNGTVSEKVTAGLSTVAVRMPNHPVALALITEANLPLAAPSANLSGKPSPTTAKHVAKDLTGRIAGIVDGGAAGVGVESTVVDCTGEIPVILRPGGITTEQISAVVGEVAVDPALLSEHEAPKSPGMKYRHYSPDAPLVLVEGSSAFLNELVRKEQENGKIVGVLTTLEEKSDVFADCVIEAGSRKELQTVASSLYDALRSFDEQAVDIIFATTFAKEGVGVAIMNRLEKAASNQIIKEN